MNERDCPWVPMYILISGRLIIFLQLSKNDKFTRLKIEYNYYEVSK